MIRQFSGHLFNYPSGVQLSHRIHTPSGVTIMNRLNGKRALITGGTSGIGLETAKQFIAEGARVVVTGTNPDTIESARRELGPNATVIRSNAGNAGEQKDLARQVGEILGQVDAVFINAGI